MSLKNTKIVGFFSLPSQSLAEHNPSAYNNAMAAAPAGAGACSECGTGILHHVVITDLDGSNRRFIGSDCALKVGLSRHQIVNRLTDEQIEARANAKAEEANARRVRAFDVLENAGIADAWAVYLETGFDTAYGAYKVGVNGNRIGRQEAIITDIVTKVVQYGSISEAQARFVKSLLSQIADRPRLEAIDAAAADFPVTSERIEIVGEVLSIKEVESQYGITWKMLVRAQAGWKVWVTAPGNPGKGDKVRFFAKVQPSKDDPKFGFGSRPTKFEIINTEAAQAAS